MDRTWIYNDRQEGMTDMDTPMYDTLHEELDTFDSRVPSLLKIGSTGEAVIALQNLLISLGYLMGVADGVFGANTQRAVKKFQTDHQLLSDGIVGPNTWAMLELTINNPTGVQYPTIKLGDRNAFVRELQLKLKVLGYFLGIVDGHFGQETKHSVQQFQADNNLVIDGIVGPNTWRAINRSFAATETSTPSLVEPLTLGSIGENVGIVQNALRALYYYQGDITNIFDEKTVAAVTQFQVINNLPATGVVDQQTWEILYAAITNRSESRQEQIFIKEGDTGSNVILLQEKLKVLDFFYSSITGSFGPATKTAVEEFQKYYGLPVTGIVDSATWRLLFSETEEVADKILAHEKKEAFGDNGDAITSIILSKPLLRLGDTGRDVNELQTMLKQLMYYDGPINGNFDNATNIAVRTFQTNNWLTADGIVGPRTWSALIYLYSPLAVCRNPDSRFIGAVIDPGHGGSDPGASGNGIIEKEMNLKISQYMANRFRELGIPFAMTRDTDETLTNVERINRMKAPFGDNENVIVVSNHNNFGGGEGAEVIYALRNTPDLARSILNEIGKAGQKTRSYYQRALPEDPTKDFYYIMRETSRLQPVIVEYGFLDNANDALRLQKNWDKYAEATVKAVAEYMGYPYYEPSGGKITYIVQRGDSLWSIANKFNTTVAAIRQLNNLTSDALSVGQQLFIPSSGVTPTPPSGNIVYVVKAGDSLWSIANRFGTTVAEIRSLNNLTSDALSIGQQLFIPGTSVEIPETSPTIHTVQSGDTLYSIASRFNTTVANLRLWNNLTSDALTIGQRLIVSQGGTPTQTFHTVVAGDSLWSIASRFNTTVANLRLWNNLTSDALSIGQRLIVSQGGAPTYRIHTVAAGDSLWTIANRFNTTVAAIRQLNNLTSDRLSIGQQLRIPNTSS